MAQKKKKSPWLQGKEAFWDGKSEADNPFFSKGELAVLVGDARQWHEGYGEARNEATREEYSV